MEYAKIVPQTLLLFFFAHMLISAIKAYKKNNSIKNQNNIANLIIGLAFIFFMLVWGGFFTPINQW